MNHSHLSNIFPIELLSLLSLGTLVLVSIIAVRQWRARNSTSIISSLVERPVSLPIVPETPSQPLNSDAHSLCLARPSIQSAATAVQARTDVRGISPPRLRACSGPDVARFFIEEVRRLDGARVSVELLEKRFFHWCRKNSIDPKSSSAFRRHVSAMGVRRKKSVGKIFYLGIEPLR